MPLPGGFLNKGNNKGGLRSLSKPDMANSKSAFVTDDDEKEFEKYLPKAKETKKKEKTYESPSGNPLSLCSSTTASKNGRSLRGMSKPDIAANREAFTNNDEDDENIDKMVDKNKNHKRKEKMDQLINFSKDNDFALLFHTINIVQENKMGDYAEFIKALVSSTSSVETFELARKILDSALKNQREDELPLTCVDSATLFISNLLRLKSILFLEIVCKPTVRSILKRTSLAIDPKECEGDVKKNIETVKKITKSTFSRVHKNLKLLSDGARELIRLIAGKAEKYKSGCDLQVVGQFLFLHFLIPAVKNPVNYGFNSDGYSPSQQFSAEIICKVLLHAATGLPFDEEDSSFTVFDSLVKELHHSFSSDITNILTVEIKSKSKKLRRHSRKSVLMNGNRGKKKVYKTIMDNVTESFHRLETYNQKRKLCEILPKTLKIEKAQLEEEKARQEQEEEEEAISISDEIDEPIVIDC